VSVQIQIRRDVSANWASKNPVLAEGEIGYDLTEKKFKVGDGITAWSGLDYSGGGGGDFVETDPTVPQYVKDITEDDISNWNNHTVAPVESVNGKTGAVSLSASDVGALPDSTVIPPPIDLTGYATETWVSNGYQVKGSYLTSESDPTVPPHVKSISQADINNWNSGGGLDQGTADARYVMKSGDSTVSGTITATDFVATSDERVKNNITTAPVGLIDSLKGREWDWKESGEKGSGVVAQELEAVLPHLVHTDDEGMKSVSYMGLLAYMIEEVKALKDEIKELKA
jgi:hypothetical protein